MSSNFKQFLFIGKESFGVTLRKRQDLGTARSAEPRSKLWYCTQCGEVYAKAPILRANGTPTTFTPVGGTCPKCPVEFPRLWRIPGSIWVSSDPDFPASLSRQALTRELLLHLNHAEQFGIPTHLEGDNE